MEADTKEGIIEYPFEEPLVVLDNEYATLTITGKMYVNPEKRGHWPYSGGAVGYSYISENHLEDATIQIYILEASVDGFMLDQQAGPFDTVISIDAGKKAKGYYYLPLDGRELGVTINSVEDFYNLDGKFEVRFKEPGGNGFGCKYHGENVLPIHFVYPIP